MQRVSRSHMFWYIVPDLMSDDREDPAVDSKQQVCELEEFDMCQTDRQTTLYLVGNIRPDLSIWYCDAA